MMSREANILRQVQTLFEVGSVGGMSDAQLLERFLARHEEAAGVAFEVLVRRHGPMVLRVCRGVLGDPHAAEDAFQATFLVLARKANGIGRPEMLGNWLYGVAHRTALKARAGAARRHRHERHAAELTGEALDRRSDDYEFAPILHEEVARLPEAYRSPVVLCHLEGMSYATAAGHLQVTEGTLRGRLARARNLLRTRLERRGVAFAAALGTMPGTREATAAVPTSLVEMTVRAAMQITTGKAAITGTVSISIATLTEEVLGAMFMTKMKTMAAGLLVAAGLISGAGWWTHRTLAEDPKARQEAPAPKVIAGEKDRVRDDRKEIQGTWTTEVSITRNLGGVPQPPLKREETWVITGDRISTTVGEEALKDGSVHEQVFFYTLAPEKTPKAIDLEEPGWGTFRGIYELDGDELRIAYGIDERPGGFDPNVDKMVSLVKLKRVSIKTQPVTPLFATAPGGYWAVHPDEPGRNGMFTSTIGGVVLMTEEAPNGSLDITLAHPVASAEKSAPEYRPIAFDKDRKRYLPKLGMGGTGGNVRGGVRISLQKFRLDPEVLPAEKVAYLGVEIVMPEAQDAAQERKNARDKDAEIKPQGPNQEERQD